MTPVHTLTAVGVLLLAGCSIPQPNTPAHSTVPSLTTTTATPATPPPPPSSEPSPTPTETSHPMHFGDTVTYADGLAFTVGPPERFTPSPTAFTMSKATTFVRFRITLVNNTATVFQTSELVTSMQSAGADISTDDVYDAPAGTWPKSPVLPGNRLSWVKGWGVPDATALQLSITPGAHPEAIFTTP